MNFLFQNLYILKKENLVNFYKYKKFGDNKTKIIELQVERGDEPYNIFITYLDC